MTASVRQTSVWTEEGGGGQAEGAGLQCGRQVSMGCLVMGDLGQVEVVRYLRDTVLSCDLAITTLVLGWVQSSSCIRMRTRQGIYGKLWQSPRDFSNAQP